MVGGRLLSHVPEEVGLVGCFGLQKARDLAGGRDRKLAELGCAVEFAAHEGKGVLARLAGMMATDAN